jgi:hypothetical protein
MALGEQPRGRQAEEVALTTPSQLGPADRQTVIKETHSGLIILVGDHAYKLKKPVNLGFLDFRTEQARRTACLREVELNRRLGTGRLRRVGHVDVTTAELQDATPAVLASHVVSRDCKGPRSMAACAVNAKENGGAGSIAEQMVALAPDVMLGGGKQYFDQTVQAGRYRGLSVLQQARVNDYQIATDAAGLRRSGRSGRASRCSARSRRTTWTSSGSAPSPPAPGPPAAGAR